MKLYWLMQVKQAWSKKVTELPYGVQNNTAAQQRPPGEGMVGSGNTSQI